jgi:hypothetical protein
MDDLVRRLQRSLPVGWSQIDCQLQPPEQTHAALCATDGKRTIVFCVVEGLVRSATSLFAFNAQMRELGLEAIWLFVSMSIPSTRHMVCASVAVVDGEWRVHIVNARSDHLRLPGSINLKQLVHAAAEQRLRVQLFSAGQRIAVHVESTGSPCLLCGALVHEIKRATFLPEGVPTAPGLELSKARLGRCVTALIGEAIARAQHLYSKKETRPNVCELCSEPRTNSLRFRGEFPATFEGLVLSSSAAYELVKHHRTAWYIA